MRVFDPDGMPQESFGGFGGGPGEVTDPLALEQVGDTVLILDGDMKIEQYVWTGAGWEAGARIQLHVGAQDLCPMREGIAVAGLRMDGYGESGFTLDPRAVHVVPYAGGSISTSFSEPYGYDEKGPLWFMVRSRLACDPGRGVVWAAYEMLNEVHALDLSGHLLWITRLADVTTPAMLEIIAPDNHSQGVAMDPEHLAPVEHITRISLLGDSILAVQVESRSMEEAPGGQRAVSFRTYFLNAGTGLGMGGFRGRHQVMGGGSGRVVLYREDPVPQFAVVPFGHGP